MMRRDDPLVDGRDEPDHGASAPLSARTNLSPNVTGLLEADDPTPQGGRRQGGRPPLPGVPCFEPADVSQ
ncbi:MAG: hypothetical protein ACREEC_04755, partial [Thermoplasmata archaeon]